MRPDETLPSQFRRANHGYSIPGTRDSIRNLDGNLDKAPT